MKLPVKYNGLTSTEKRTIREEYIQLQNSRCFFCRANLTGPPATKITDDLTKINWDLFPGGRNFLRYPIHLQHDHISGMTEGAVHALCNAWWWQFKGR
jgi:hypothetical protein